MVRVIDGLRKAEKAIKRDFSKNDVSNREAFSKRCAEDPGFSMSLIEKQANFRDMSLGKSTLDYSGCEVIAAYNLLQNYGEGKFRVPLPELIEVFEKDGILYAGRFGVSPRSIVSFLTGIGLSVSFTTEEEDFDLLGSLCDHLILTVMNDREDIFRQVHTFYISKVKDHFITHNAGLRMRYFEISEIIKALPGGRAKGICLIGIREGSEESVH